jgi:hypothetical protein
MDLKKSLLTTTLPALFEHGLGGLRNSPESLLYTSLLETDFQLADI